MICSDKLAKGLGLHLAVLSTCHLLKVSITGLPLKVCIVTGFIGFSLLLHAGSGAFATELDMPDDNSADSPIIYGIAIWPEDETDASSKQGQKERVITVVVYPPVAQVGANNFIGSSELVLKDSAPSETELHAIQAQTAKLAASYIESHKLNGAQAVPSKPISEQLENSDIVVFTIDSGTLSRVKSVLIDKMAHDGN
ncbi:MAG: hypothetical protein Pg6C_01140 [Treponemataceae bacterium]|nr:MAG: hypothetical protein Pg6C_01140 [Treponemataceae bacterium]